MKNEDFDMLLSSIKEAGDIKQGKKKPSRTFEIDAPEIKMVRKSLCVSAIPGPPGNPHGLRSYFENFVNIYA